MSITYAVIAEINTQIYGNCTTADTNAVKPLIPAFSHPWTLSSPNKCVTVIAIIVIIINYYYYSVVIYLVSIKLINFIREILNPFYLHTSVPVLLIYYQYSSFIYDKNLQNTVRVLQQFVYHRGNTATDTLHVNVIYVDNHIYVHNHSLHKDTYALCIPGVPKNDNSVLILR